METLAFKILFVFYCVSMYLNLHRLQERCHTFLRKIST